MRRIPDWTVAGRRVAGRPGGPLAAVIVGLLLCACSGATAQRGKPSQNGWTALLADYLRQHPVAEAQDVYKFTYQSVYGPAHLITNVEGVRRYLEKEIAGLASGEPGEPLLDVLSDSPPLVRVNLRPFVAAGGDPEALLGVLVQSANQVHGDATLMAARLTGAAGLLRRLGREELAEQLDGVTAEQASRSFPALHHSAAYTAAYDPAYRVVLRPLIEPELPSQAP